MAYCEVVGCDEEVNKPGHTLCYDHWCDKRDGELSNCSSCGRLKTGDKPLCWPCYKQRSDPAPSKQRSESRGERESAPAKESEVLSATDLGAEFGVSAQRMNLILAEFGWIQKESTKGWTPTPQGIRVGAIAREAYQSGIPYVVWDFSKLRKNKGLFLALREMGIDSPDAVAAAQAATAAQSLPAQASPAVIASSDGEGAGDVGGPNFRDHYETPYRTQDGHRVRSRAEMVIDDWLYQHGLVHAYERAVRVDDEADQITCDFWLPQKRIYIEFWGMDDPAYLEKKRKKKEIYSKYGLTLVELSDVELKSIDDHLPRLLRKHGLSVD